MPDEWVCDACGHTTSVDPIGAGCPHCESEMIKMDASDGTEKDSKGKYSKEEEDTPIEDMTDLDFEDEVPEAA